MDATRYESERRVLGAIFLDNGALARVRAAVKPGDFINRRNRNVFSAMVVLANRGEPIDAVRVESVLYEQGLLGASDGLGYVLGLVEEVATAQGIDRDLAMLTACKASNVTESIDRRIGSEVRALRRGKNLSQEDMAKALSTSRALIGHMETGRQPWTVARVAQAADALGASALLILCSALTSPESQVTDEVISAVTEGVKSLNAEIGHRVSERRRALRMTQAGLARAVGISHAQMSRLEAGQYDWPARLLVSVGAALGVHPGVLVMGPSSDGQITPDEIALIQATRERRPMDVMRLSTRLMEQP